MIGLRCSVGAQIAQMHREGALEREEVADLTERALIEVIQDFRNKGAAIPVFIDFTGGESEKTDPFLLTRKREEGIWVEFTPDVSEVIVEEVRKSFRDMAQTTILRNPPPPPKAEPRPSFDYTTLFEKTDAQPAAALAQAPTHAPAEDDFSGLDALDLFSPEKKPAASAQPVVSDEPAGRYHRLR